MKITCATSGCGREVPKPQGRSRPRKYCLECRPRWRKPGAVVDLAPVEAKPQGVGLVATYQTRLKVADRLATPEGEHVMLLAEMLAAGGHTASGAASLSRELRAAMEEALKGAPTSADALDELATRRERKASGA